MKKLNKIFASLFAAITLVFTSFSLTACGNDSEDASAKQAPIYIGMEVVSTSDETEDAENVSLMNYSYTGDNCNSPEEYLENHYEEYDYRDYHYHGDCYRRNDQIDQDYPFGGGSEDGESETPSIEEAIEDESTLQYLGTDKDRYYAEPDEYVFVKIYFSNPDNYVILSFDFNGEAYASYMFQDGSTMQCIILKVNVGSSSGLYDYTIDKIKYVDGTDIKDVLINGDQTVSVAVNGEGVTSASVTNEEIGLTSISFDVRLYDSYNLIEDANGFAKVYLYDGETIIGEQTLEVGTNSVIFENLKSNTIYQYAVVAYFDDLTGDGESLHTFVKKAFYTDTIVLFDNITVDYQSISYSYSWNENVTNKTITQAVYDASDLTTQLDAQIDEENDTYTISNLLTNHEYVIVTTYKNTYNEDEYIYISFKTLEYTVPSVEINITDKTTTSIVAVGTLTDDDNVATITSIELYNGNELIKTFNAIDDLSADNLSEHETYEYVIKYEYNLYDGNGIQYKTFTYEFIAQKDIVITSTTISNTSAVSLEEKVYLTFTTLSYDVTYKSVKINGVEYDVVTTAGTKVYVDIPIDDTFLGGDTTFNIEEIVAEENSVTATYEVSGNTYASIFINGIISVDNIELYGYEDGNFVSVNYLMPSDDLYLYITLTNKTGYKIDSVTISSIVYTDILTIDDDHIAVKIASSSGTNTKILTQITYSNEYVSSKEYSTKIASNSVFVVSSNDIKYISTAEDLRSMSGGYYYELTNDIDLSGIEWSNPGSFYGVFNGNGYSIKNMSYNSTITLNETKYIGLFSEFSGGVIFDLDIEDVSFRLTATCVNSSTYTLFVGGIAGYATNNLLVIDNVSISGIIDIDFDKTIYLGGLIGYNNNGSSLTTITNCYITGNISATSSGSAYAGGLVGYNFNYLSITITNCCISGDISAKNCAGGLIGYNNSPSSSTVTITNCYTIGDISSNSYAGGLIGLNSIYYSVLIISNSYTTGSVSVTSTSSYAYAGGLIGDNYDEQSTITITNCYVTGDVSSTGSSRAYSGGLVGRNYSYDDSSTTVITNCYTTGDVSATSTSSSAYAGGLIGYSYNDSSSSTITITNCYTSDQQVITITKNGTTTNTPSNSYGETTELANLQDPTWLTETLGWGEYVSEEDLAENENNVWIFEENEYPKLYFQS